MRLPDEMRRDVAAAVVLATLSLTTSVLLDAGVICSNDGSHYALTRALADDGSAVIDDYLPYTREVDFARMGHHDYSDRPPGTALLAVPVYAATSALHLRDVARQSLVVLVPALFGALAVVFTFLLARRFDASRTGAFLAAMLLALGTLHRSYASALFSHAISSALLLATILLAMPRTFVQHRRRAQLLAGLVGGYACGVDYSSVVPVAVACLVATALEGPSLRVRAESLAVFAAGGLVGVLPALAYHTLVFGGPFAIGYHYTVSYPHTHALHTLYGGSFSAGLFALTLSPESGLLVHSPALLLSLAAAPAFARASGRRAALVLLPAIALFLLTCFNFTPAGGASRDARYLMTVLPLLVVPSAWAFEWAKRRGRRAFAGAVSLLALSMVIQAIKHHAMWVRDGEVWLTHFARSTDFFATLSAFLRWAAPHPLFAATVLFAGLYVARRVWPEARMRGDAAL